MTYPVARYIIVLDRMDDDEAVGPDGDWPTSDKEGMEQVAAELQEAMERTGQPAGFFRVVSRHITDCSAEGAAIHACDEDEAVDRAREALGR